MIASWSVVFCKEFQSEFSKLPNEVQDELLALLILLRQFGPNLGRPYVDTLKGSKFANMKELRFRKLELLWRFAFAFDPERVAIVLTGGNKRGKNQVRFYRELISKADGRYTLHLSRSTE